MECIDRSHRGDVCLKKKLQIFSHSFTLNLNRSLHRFVSSSFRLLFMTPVSFQGLIFCPPGSFRFSDFLSCRWVKKKKKWLLWIAPRCEYMCMVPCVELVPRLGCIPAWCCQQLNEFTETFWLTCQVLPWFTFQWCFRGGERKRLRRDALIICIYKWESWERERESTQKAIPIWYSGNYANMPQPTEETIKGGGRKWYPEIVR